MPSPRLVITAVSGGSLTGASEAPANVLTVIAQEKANSRYLEVREQNMHLRVQVTVTLPANSGAQWLRAWISKDAGATWLFRGDYSAATLTFDWDEYAPYTAETWKVKVSSAAASGENGIDAAVPSAPFAVTGLGDPAANVISNASLGALTYDCDADGNWSWGIDKVQWDIAVANNVWTTRLLRQRGRKTGPNDFDWEAAPDEEGKSMPVVEFNRPGATVSLPIASWPIPPAGYLWREYRFWLEARSRKESAYPWVLQLSCWPGGKLYCDITPAVQTGKIPANRLDQTTLGPGVGVGPNGLQLTTSNLDNILTNGDFEFGTKGWLLNSGATLITDGSVSYTGKNAVTMYGISPVGDGTGCSSFSEDPAYAHACRPGDEVYWEFWAWSSPGKTGYLVPRMYILNENKATTWTLDLPWITGTNGQWTKVSGRLTIPLSNNRPKDFSYFMFLLIDWESQLNDPAYYWVIDNVLCRMTVGGPMLSPTTFYSSEIAWSDTNKRYEILNISSQKVAQLSTQFQWVPGENVTKIVNLDATIIKTGALQVGGPNMPSQVKIYDTAGTLIGWEGDDRASSGYYGTWRKGPFYIGGTPSQPRILIDSNGNVGINDGSLQIFRQEMSGYKTAALSAAITDSQTSIAYFGATGSFNYGDLIYVGSEQMTVTALSVPGGGGSGTVSVTRGTAFTARAPHGSGLTMTYGAVGESYIAAVNAAWSVNLGATFTGFQVMRVSNTGHRALLINRGVVATDWAGRTVASLVSYNGDPTGGNTGNFWGVCSIAEGTSGTEVIRLDGYDGTIRAAGGYLAKNASGQWKNGIDYQSVYGSTLIFVKGLLVAVT